jgi:hypothetical protein
MIILGTLAVGVIASLLWPEKDEDLEDEPEGGVTTGES